MNVARLSLLFILLTAACGPEKRQASRERRDRAALGEAAGAYWDAVRWNDAGRSSMYLEDPKEQLKLGRQLAEPRYRITDVSVMQVVVGDELPEDRLPERREGTAVVRIEAWETHTNRVDTWTFEQQWHKVERAWFVDVERSPLGADRPWP